MEARGSGRYTWILFHVLVWAGFVLGLTDFLCVCFFFTSGIRGCLISMMVSEFRNSGIQDLISHLFRDGV